MPHPVTDVDKLAEYIRGVIDRADHHATSVDQIALAVAGAIVWRKDAEPIEVMAHDGEMKNVLWVRIGGSRYALSYNHLAGTIEVRRGTTRGAVLESFSNANSAGEVKTFFEGL